MQPHAEMVHWFFGAGILFVGLCLLAEAIVGTEVWRMRPWRAYLWPGVAFALGVLLWPVMALFTNSAIHMYAHGSWAEVLMLAGGSELALVRGRLHSKMVAAHLAARVPRQRNRVHRARAELVVLRSLGVPASHARLDVHRDGGLPAGSDLAAAVGGAPRRLRADDRARLAAALRRPRRRAGLRPPVAARGGAAPMRALLVIVAVALVLPAVASAHATLVSTAPALRHRAAAGARTRFACTSTRPSRRCPVRCAS